MCRSTLFKPWLTPLSDSVLQQHSSGTSTDRSFESSAAPAPTWEEGSYKTAGWLQEDFQESTRWWPWFVFYLGDNPENRRTWSAHSGKLPTFRVGRGLHWSASARRWLVAREKLAALGFPCDSASAAAMGVPEIPIKCTKRASAVAGNAMHFGSVAVAQLVTLCCFAKRSWSILIN